MPGTVLVPQTVVPTGLNPTYSAAAAAMSIANSGRCLVHVKNGSGGSINVTAIYNGTDPDGLIVPDRVVAIPAGQERIIGPFSMGIYNFSDGTIELDFSATASVTVAAFLLPAA